MGQYHLTVNLDKKQFLDPHKLGDGLKLMEFGNSAGGVMTGLAILLAVSNNRGGGDLHSDNELIGSWGGDRIAIIGDYAEDKDLPTEFSAGAIYEACRAGLFRDISDDVRKCIEEDGMFVFLPGEGWITRVYRHEATPEQRAQRPDIWVTVGAESSARHR